MEKIQYYFAAVYQSIKSRRPDGTPYLSLCLVTTGFLLLSILNILLILKIWFHTNLIAQSKNAFIVSFLSLSVLIILLFRAIIPIDMIKDVEVDQKDIKVQGVLSILYFMLNIALMLVLLILTRPKS